MPCDAMDIKLSCANHLTKHRLSALSPLCNLCVKLWALPSVMHCMVGHSSASMPFSPTCQESICRSTKTYWCAATYHSLDLPHLFSWFICTQQCLFAGNLHSPKCETSAHGPGISGRFSPHHSSLLQEKVEILKCFSLFAYVLPNG